MSEIFFNSVERLPHNKAAAAFTVDSAAVFRDDADTVPTVINENLSYVPWGHDNQLPFHILNLIESDETLTTCQVFNAEVCYGSGLEYNTHNCTVGVKSSVDEFMLDNDLPSYFLGCCQDFKYFGFCVSLIVLSRDAKRIARVIRKEACYCRFTPADKNGRIEKVLYANWRKSGFSEEDIQAYELLDASAPFLDLLARLNAGAKERVFAVVSRIPTPDSTYYPIPYYASLFKGKWYNIKTLIGMAKEAKLRNSAPIKYHIEVNAKYWENMFRQERITDPKKQQERVVEEKQNILDFLTGVENSGKVWFSTCYMSPDGKEQHDVVINRIETSKEGGDWASDIQEAINMFCFTLRVHSNLVGSVPGKAQSNNSGSDKRELYTIAQALQKPYHDVLFNVHRLVIRFNKWKGAYPDCPFVMLTTLDEHTDAKYVTPNKNNNDGNNE